MSSSIWDFKRLKILIQQTLHSKKSRKKYIWEKIWKKLHKYYKKNQTNKYWLLISLLITSIYRLRGGGGSDPESHLQTDVCSKNIICSALKSLIMGDLDDIIMTSDDLLKLRYHSFPFAWEIFWFSGQHSPQLWHHFLTKAGKAACFVKNT